MTMQEWLEPIAGGTVLLLTLLDVFFTVLYARAGTGLLAPRLAAGVWHLFRMLAGRSRHHLLNFCGPVQLVLLVATWGMLLAVGAALIMHPALGIGVKSSSGPTDTDFMTALLAGGSSMSIVGASDYGPASPGFKLLYLFNSLVGMSVTSLTLTYLMQVYTALRSRNALGLTFHSQSAETGDAAELLARWGPCGRFDGGYSNLSDIAGQLTGIKESHHFYPVLFYFRFDENFYAPPRFLLTALDVVALVKTALDERSLGWLRESAALTELEHASNLLLDTLDQRFPVQSAPAGDDPQLAEQVRQRFMLALRRLHAAGIPTREDHDRGAHEYLALRAQWQPRIEALAPVLAMSMKDVDPARYGVRPG
jgi:hypothetical protein